MSIFNDTKKMFGYMIHSKGHSDQYTPGRALAFYYKAMIIPMVVAAIVAGIVGGSLSSIGASIGVAAAVVSVILSFVIAIPVMISAVAAWMQLISKFLFKIWKGDYGKTAAATVMGIAPLVIFYWLTSILSYIPYAKYVNYVFVIWAAVILTLALSEQQGIGKARAFAGWIIPAIIGVVIIMLVTLAIIGSVSAVLGSIMALL